jgi:hypothetical protein
MASTKSCVSSGKTITQNALRSHTSIQPCAGDGKSSAPQSKQRNVLTAPREAAKDVTEEQHNDAVQRLSVYKEFVLKEVLRVDKRDALMVLPITSQAVDYRDGPVS